MTEDFRLSSFRPLALAEPGSYRANYEYLGPLEVRGTSVTAVSVLYMDRRGLREVTILDPRTRRRSIDDDFSLCFQENDENIPPELSAIIEHSKTLAVD